MVVTWFQVPLKTGLLETGVGVGRLKGGVGQSPWSPDQAKSAGEQLLERPWEGKEPSR